MRSEKKGDKLDQKKMAKVDGGANKPKSLFEYFQPTALAADRLFQIPQSSSNKILRQSIVRNHQQRFGNQSALKQILSAVGSDYKLLQRNGTPISEIEGDPTAPPDDGTMLHPWLRSGSDGPAVEELQQKLNQDGADPALQIDGIFGPLTRAGVVAFQEKYSLAVDGVVGPETWGKIDDLGLTSTVGRVEREWSEEVGGQTYGMTSRYTWRILGNEMRITVKLRFFGENNPGAIATSFAGIRSTWNTFKAVNTTTGDEYNIEFVPEQVGGGEDNAVRLTAGNGRSDAGNWFIGDPDLAETAAHEFGHMIGLEDEYQRTHTDYQRLVGEEPPTGADAGEGAADPADVAEELHDALQEAVEADRVSEANTVITTHGLQQGEYAQQIAAAYQTAYGIGIVQDIVDRIPDENEWSIVDPFTHSSGSIMGMGTTHAHPVEPRHLREFLGYLQAAVPGEYEVEAR